MDTSEPSTNGTSASNLFRLSSLLGDDADLSSSDQQSHCEGGYSERAKETIAAFEAEILQYPWGFGSFMPGVVAGRLGVTGIMAVEGPSVVDAANNSSVPAPDDAIAARARAPRGGLSSILKISPSSGAWLKQRNPLLRDVAFPAAGRVRVMVCENGVCREEGAGLEEGVRGLDIGGEEVGAAAAAAAAASGEGKEAESESGKGEALEGEGEVVESVTEKEV
jgi:hypothetical protein